VKIIDSQIDPVFVARVIEKVELRIGEPKPGESRYALLTPLEAKVLAYALLAEAERVASSPIPPAM
jgi:hypothetical protein